MHSCEREEKEWRTQEKKTATPYDLDGRPPLKIAIPLGLQHVLAMFVGNLTPLADHHRSLWDRGWWSTSGGTFTERHADRWNCDSGTDFYDWTDRWQTSYRNGNQLRIYRRMSERMQQ